jgi:hypothetical protein
MISFKRRNLIDAVFVFAANDGSTSQPTSASLTLYYLAADGSGPTVTVVPLFGLQGQQWVGSWLSDVAAPGRVDWEVSCTGPLIVVEEGSFYLTGNAANAVAT